MADTDLYAVLGLARGASDDDIKRAYRELARKLHPDRNPGDRQAEERFKEVGYAKEILTNPEKRKLYDEFGEMGLREGFNPDAYKRYQAWGSARGAGGDVRLEDLFGGAAGGSPKWAENLQDLFGGGGFDTIFGKRAERPRGRDLVADMRIAFVEALRGTRKEITYGLGRRGKTRTIQAGIPAGVRNGERVRLRGQGLDGGDLVLRVSVDEHGFLRREDDDLHLELPVTVREAYRGAKVPVPTLEGEVALRIPAGVQSGARLRLRGKGVPGRGTRPAGDMIVHVLVQVPEAGAERTGALVDELEELYARHPRHGLRL